MRVVKLLGVLVFAIVVASGAFVWGTWRELRRFRDTPFGTGAEKVVEIPQGTSPHGVVRLLAASGVLSSEAVAWRYLRWWKRDPRPMKAGEYAFSGAHTPDEVLERLYRGDVKTYRFAGYHETMAFVNAIAWIAHRADHHPDLSVHFNRVVVSYSTHDAGGVTGNDVTCAARVESLQR